MITMYVWREWRLVRPRLFGAAALLVMAAVAAAFDIPRGMRNLGTSPDAFSVFGMVIGVVLFAGTTLVEGRCGSGGAFVGRMPGAFGPTLRANVMITVTAIVLAMSFGALLCETLVAGFAIDPRGVGSAHRLLPGASPWWCVAVVPWLLCAGGLAPRGHGVLPIGFLLLMIVVVPPIVLQNVTGLPLYLNEASDVRNFALWSAACGLVATMLVQRDRFRMRNPWWKPPVLAAFAAMPLLGVGIWRADDLGKFDPRDPSTRVSDLRHTDDPNVVFVRLQRRVAPGVVRFHAVAVDLRSGIHTPWDDTFAPPKDLHEHWARIDGLAALPNIRISRFVGNAYRVWSPRRHDPHWEYFDLTRGRVIASPYMAAWPLSGEWVVVTADRGDDRYRLFDPETVALRPVVGLLEAERIECVLDAHRVVVFRRGERTLTALDPATGERTTLAFTGPSPEQFVTHVDVVHRTVSGSLVLRIGFARQVLYAKVDGDTLVSTAALTSVEAVTGLSDRELIASENGKVFRLTFGSDAKELVFPR